MVLNDTKMASADDSPHPPPYKTDPSQPVQPSVGGMAQNYRTDAIIQTPIVAAVTPVKVEPVMGPKPAQVVCGHCKIQIVSRVESKATTKTHIFALVLCLFACWPCVCIPYCVDSCKNADHYCPNCNAYIGSYKH